MEAQNNFTVRNMRIFARVLSIPAFIALIWAIFVNLNEFNSLLDTSIQPDAGIIIDYEIGHLKLNKVKASTDTEEAYVYVTYKGISYLAPQENQTEELSTNFGFTKMTGLESYPSFLVIEKHKAFWKSQFYLEILFRYAGFAVIFITMLVFSELNFKQNNKLFTKEVKWGLGGFMFVIYGAYFGGYFLYGRMILFLNKEFYLGESIVGGGSQELLFMGTILLFLFIVFERAIPIQKEQDLTV